MTTTETPIVGVASIHDFDLDALTSLHEFDPAWEEHKETCEKYKAEGECDCMDYAETDITYYADAEWQKGEDGLWDAPGATMKFASNDRGYVQVLLSPHTERHGKCSPCYPGQADLDAEGDLLCYAVPPDMKR